MSNTADPNNNDDIKQLPWKTIIVGILLALVFIFTLVFFIVCKCTKSTSCEYYLIYPAEAIPVDTVKNCTQNPDGAMLATDFAQLYYELKQNKQLVLKCNHGNVAFFVLVGGYIVLTCFEIACLAAILLKDNSEIQFAKLKALEDMKKDFNDKSGSSLQNLYADFVKSKMRYLVNTKFLQV